MADIYINSDELKLIASGMKQKSTSIIEAYQNEAAVAIQIGDDSLKVSGLDTSIVLNSFNKIFTTLNARISLLADFLTNTVANEYDDVSSAIKNEFDKNFASELAGLLGIRLSSSKSISGSYVRRNTTKSDIIYIPDDNNKSKEMRTKLSERFGNTTSKNSTSGATSKSNNSSGNKSNNTTSATTTSTGTKNGTSGTPSSSKLASGGGGHSSTRSFGTSSSSRSTTGTPSSSKSASGGGGHGSTGSFGTSNSSRSTTGTSSSSKLASGGGGHGLTGSFGTSSSSRSTTVTPSSSKLASGGGGHGSTRSF